MLRYRQRQQEDNDDVMDVDDNKEEVYFEGRPRYVSDQTAFMRWSTEIEKVDKIIDDDFLEENRHRVMDINKILPLSFIEDKRSVKLFRLRRMLIDRCKDAGLLDLADETVLDNLADYQTTRGIRGNYQNALITQRREWQDKSEANRKEGFVNRLLGNAREDNRNELMEER